MTRILIVAAALLLLLCMTIAVSYASSRDPFDAPLHMHAGYFLMAVLGGAVRWYGQMRAGSVQSKAALILLGDMMTAAFAGLLAYLLCVWADATPAVTGLCVGLAGHMGARAIALFERWGEQMLRRAGFSTTFERRDGSERRLGDSTGAMPLDDGKDKRR